jgi:hypothetical protein
LETGREAARVKSDVWLIAFRTTVMSGISVLAFYNRLNKVHALRLRGLRVETWDYGMLAVWAMGFVIWLVVGWWDLQRYGALGRENR